MARSFARTVRLWIVVAAMLATSASSALAGPLEDGGAAFMAQDWDNAFRLLSPLAEQGNAEAELLVGELYQIGRGAPLDRTRGLSLVRAAADQDLAAAEYALGVDYLDGLGVPMDTALAVFWFRKAADHPASVQGVANAALDLVRLYGAAGVVPKPKDMAEISRLYRKAVEGFSDAGQRGDVDSLLALARMYEAGEGVDPDPAKAKDLYGQAVALVASAAQRGDARAEARLGGLYRRGVGVPRDDVMAAGWYLKAAEQGDSGAAESMSALYAFHSFPDRIAPASPADHTMACFWLTISAQTAVPALRDSAASVRDQACSGLPQSAQTATAWLADQWRPSRRSDSGGLHPGLGDLRLTDAQAAELERLRSEWHPSPAAVEAALREARSYDMTLGSPTARVTIVLYTSAGCPICARWLNDTFPALEQRYIRTGIARLTIREILTGDAAAATQGFLLARCGGADRYFTILQAEARRTIDILENSPVRSRLQAIATSFGIGVAAFNACVDDPSAIASLKRRSEVNAEQDKVDSTPTFTVGDQMLYGLQTIDQLGAAITQALTTPPGH